MILSAPLASPRLWLQEGVMIKLPIILATVIAAVPCCA
jgi:hypothetical protein